MSFWEAYFELEFLFWMTIIQGSLNYPFWGALPQCQIYGKFEGFLLIVHCLGWCQIMTPVITHDGCQHPAVCFFLGGLKKKGVLPAGFLSSFRYPESLAMV